MENYFLKVAGYRCGPPAKCLYLMDNSPQHKILQMFIMKFNDRRRVASYSAVDEFGTEKFLAVKTFDENEVERYMVTVGSELIGEYEINTRLDGDGHIKIQTFNESGGTTIQGNMQKVKKQTHCEFKTALGNKVCDMFNQYRGTFNVVLDGLLDEQARFLLFSVGVFVVHLRVVGSYYLSNTSISIQQKDLKIAIRKTNTLGTAVEINKLIQSKDTVITIVGHDSLKNIVYYNVHERDSCTVYATIEVTPVKDYQGYAQMEIKDSVGSTLCTAIHFPQHEITALYDNKNSLFAYRQHMKISDIKSQPVLEVIDMRTNKYSTLGTFSNMALKYIHPTQKYRYAEEAGMPTGGRKIVRCKRQGKYTFYQLIGILVLSMHCRLSLESFGNLSPEIKYFYFNRKPATHSYIF